MTIDDVKYWTNVAFANYDDDFNAEEVENVRIIAIRSLEAWEKVLEALKTTCVKNIDCADMITIIERHRKEVTDDET